MRIMHSRLTRRIAAGFLLVFVASLLAPTFAFGTMDLTDAAPMHTSTNSSLAQHDGHGQPGHVSDAGHADQHDPVHRHEHGHALDAHGNFGHVLDHLNARPAEYLVCVTHALAYYERAEPALIVAPSPRTCIFRPPRPVPYA